jgi:hypothetical protein
VDLSSRLPLALRFERFELSEPFIDSPFAEL